MTTLDLGSLGLDRGGHLRVKRELSRLAPGERIRVVGTDPDLAVHLRAWSRAWGCPYDEPSQSLGAPAWSRWTGAERAGRPGQPDANARSTWGLAARGAAVEAGVPAFDFGIEALPFSEEIPRIYAAAAASQWDPATAIDWSAPVELAGEVEDAVVQVMSYLVENETAALLVPARFCAQVHPHFREMMQCLAIQCADEARHIEVFTRRISLRGHAPGLSTAGGQASLKTLVDEPDFALASFMLSVLGEGSFLALLRFLDHYGPDPVTRQVCRLAAQDEARHVALGVAHLELAVRHDRSLLARLAQAVESRHAALSQASGLNEEVFDALLLIAAGSWDRLEAGWDAVVSLKQHMDQGRRLRLRRIGFDEATAGRLSGLHTRNFM